MDAILGTTVKVTTLGTNELSEVDLKIPAGTWAWARQRGGVVFAGATSVELEHHACFNAAASMPRRLSATQHALMCLDLLGVPILFALSSLGTGTQPGTTLVMSKRGVPKLGSNARGDHLVHVKVGMLLQGAVCAVQSEPKGQLPAGPGREQAGLACRRPRRSRSPRASAARSGSSWSSCASCRGPSQRAGGGSEVGGRAIMEEAAVLCLQLAATSWRSEAKQCNPMEM